MLRALDLFCGGGGAARGILAAGFDEIVGIDIADHRKNYPGHFIRGDALNPPVRLKDFDLVWASPPCQAFSRAGASGSGWGKNLGDRRGMNHNFIPETLRLLHGHPFSVVENVPEAPIRADIILTGPMFGLDRIIRRRHFQISFVPPMHAPLYDWACKPKDQCTITKSMSSNPMFRKRKEAGLKGRLPIAEARAVMGLDAPLTCEETGEAVPPAYAEFIAKAALSQLQSNHARD